MFLCRSISDKADVPPWIKQGPKAEKLGQAFEPSVVECGSSKEFHASVNLCTSYTDIVLTAMAVRNTRSVSMKNSPVIVAVAIHDEMLDRVGIEKKHTPKHGTTGFGEIDSRHYDLISGDETSFTALAVELYRAHLKSGDVIYTLNNGCILHGCKSLLALNATQDSEATKRLAEAVTWLEQTSDILSDIEVCDRPPHWNNAS